MIGAPHRHARCARLCRGPTERIGVWRRFSLRTTRHVRCTRRRMLRVTRFTLTLALVAGCAGKTAPLPTDNDNGNSAGADGGADAATKPLPAPTDHRSHGSQCEPTAPGAEPGLTEVDAGAGLFMCRTNEECTAHPGGRCIWNSGACGEPCAPRPPSSACAYDQCAIDTNCPNASACICGSGGLSTNSCAPVGTCRVDADCATGYCSPGKDPCTGGLTGFFCHTPRDECTNDNDCADATGVAAPKCVVDARTHVWTCMRDQCGGAGAM